MYLGVAAIVWLLTHGLAALAIDRVFLRGLDIGWSDIGILVAFLLFAVVSYPMGLWAIRLQSRNKASV